MQPDRDHPPNRPDGRPDHRRRRAVGRRRGTVWRPARGQPCSPSRRRDAPSPGLMREGCGSGPTGRPIRSRWGGLIRTLRCIRSRTVDPDQLIGDLGLGAEGRWIRRACAVKSGSLVQPTMPGCSGRWRWSWMKCFRLRVRTARPSEAACVRTSASLTPSPPSPFLGSSRRRDRGFGVLRRRGAGNFHPRRAWPTLRPPRSRGSADRSHHGACGHKPRRSPGPRHGARDSSGAAPPR